MRKDYVMGWTEQLREKFSKGDRLVAEIKRNLVGAGV